MDKALEELIRISNTVGRDSLLIQGVGGNTSVKTDDGKYMYIKASGTALKDMTSKSGWRKLEVEPVAAILQDKNLAKMQIHEREAEVVKRTLAACDQEIKAGIRPSVESGFHAVLDRCVIHLHPVAVLAYACAKNGKAELEKLFKEQELRPVWVSYVNPGFSLGQKIYHLVRDYQEQYGRKPAIMFIEKHGLLVTDDNEDMVLELVRDVISRCNAGLKSVGTDSIEKVKWEEIANFKQAIKKAYLDSVSQKTSVSHFTNQIILSFLAREDSKKLLKAPAVTPDEMGFVNSPITWLEKCDSKTVTDKINSSIANGQKPPVALLVKDAGLFIAAEAHMAHLIKDIVVGSLFIRSNAQNMGGINALSKQEQDFISNWEGESLRIELARSKNANG